MPIYIFPGKVELNSAEMSYLSVTNKLLAIKKHPFLEKRVFTYQKLVCEEFLICLIYLEKVLNIYSINYYFFS